ncbi:MAG: hypothetical protein K0S74_53 [Chlamydiales bacterium]|nr:hypothetical protein [Chlamydiales bacterium]
MLLVCFMFKKEKIPAKSKDVKKLSFIGIGSKDTDNKVKSFPKKIRFRESQKKFPAISFQKIDEIAKDRSFNKVNIIFREISLFVNHPQFRQMRSLLQGLNINTNRLRKEQIGVLDVVLESLVQLISSSENQHREFASEWQTSEGRSIINQSLPILKDYVKNYPAELQEISNSDIMQRQQLQAYMNKLESKVDWFIAHFNRLDTLILQK